MTGSRRGLAAIGVGALVLGLGLIPVIVTSRFGDLRGVQVALMLLGGWGFTASGLFTRMQRPDSPMGSIMAFTGFAWLISFAASSNAPLVFSLGSLVSNLFAAAVIHLLLAFPSGHLRSRWDRAVVATGYFTVNVVLIPALLFTDPRGEQGCDGCPRNALLISDNDTVSGALSAVASVLGVLLLVVVAVELARRYRAASGPERRVVLGVYLLGGLTLSGLTLALAADLVDLAHGLTSTFYLLGVSAFTLLPYGFFAGLARTRMLRAGAMTSLLARLGDRPAPGALRDAIARVLGDDSVLLAYWLPEQDRWVDASGGQVDAPVPGPGRAVMPVMREGEQVAAIAYDPSAGDEELVGAIAGAAGLAMENERLDAELRARLDELRSSRARLVQAGMAERRRLERDLHDGAQQRLVSLALNLRVAQGKLEDDPQGAGALLTGAARELELALEELRELARGIHPAVLSDRGLDAALAGLAARAPLPVDVQSEVNGDVPDAIESAAYFVVSEALTNVAKYAHAATASVHLEHSHGFVSVAVRDDGVGGADPSTGSGLRGLGDRVSALDGRLEIDSREGRGTTIRARFPCA